MTNNNHISAYDKESGVIVSGLAEPGNAVELMWGGVQKSVTADADGNWSVVYSNGEAPTDGVTTLRATATDVAGNVSASATQTITVDTIAPSQLTLDPVTGDNRITAAEQAAGLTLTGSAEASSKVGGINVSLGPKLDRGRCHGQMVIDAQS